MGIFKKKTKTVTEEAPVKAESKVLVFYGKECGLFPYHVATLLKTAEREKDILLIDNSRSQDLFDSVPNQDGIGDAGGMYVLSRREFDRDIFSYFDYVLVYLGTYADPVALAGADILYLTHDYTPVCTRFFTGTAFPARREEQTVIAAFMGRAASKVREKDLLKELPVIHKDDTVLVTEAAAEDQAGYLTFLYQGNPKISSMSGDWRNLISESAATVNGELASVYKKAAKSKQGGY